MRKLLLGMMALGAMANGGEASAAPCQTGPQPYSYWSGLGATGCQIIDKTIADFTVASGTAPDSLQIALTSSSFGAGSVTVTFSSFGGSFTPFGISYSIKVDPPSTDYISTVQLTANVTGSPGGTWASISEASNKFTPLNVPPTPQSQIISGTQTVLNVTQSFASTSLNSVSASYVQAVVPEIDALSGTGALTLLGAALALAAERRRKS